MDKKQKLFLEYISAIPQLEFGHFIDYPDWVREAFLGDRETPKQVDLIDRKPSTAQQQAQWFTQVLNAHGFTETFYLGFAGIPFAQVKVIESQGWIEALLAKVNTGWLLLSLEMDKMLFIKATEVLLHDDCYVAYLFLKPE